jgi:hypothetical protein
VGNGSSGKFTLPDGSSFSYINREGRQEALRLAESTADSLQSVIENRIGRKLRSNEGRGLKDRPPLDASTESSQRAKWRNILEGPEIVKENDPVSIAKRRLQRYEDSQEELADPKLYAIKADLRKAEEAKAAQEAKEAMMAQPAYASAIKIAKEKLFAAKMNPNVSSLVISDLEGLVEYLGTGKADYKIVHDIDYAITQQIKNDIGIKVQNVKVLISQHNLEVKELQKQFYLPEQQNVTVESPVDSTPQS